jgi:hypothetical protein
MTEAVEIQTILDYLKVTRQMYKTFQQNGARIPPGNISYHDWVIQNGKVVKTRPTAEIRKEYKEVGQSLRRHKPKPKACYLNSGVMAMHCANVEYVLGYVMSVFPILHVWNRIGDTHFDITQDIVLKKTFPEHFAVASLSGDEVYNWLAKSDTRLFPTLEELWFLAKDTK